MFLPRSSRTRCGILVIRLPLPTTARSVRLIRTGKFRLVVSDWDLPEMSGVEICRSIRRRQSSSYIYVILVTSFDGVENVVEGLNAGADDFLTKPIQPEELRMRLRVGERILSLESRDVVIFSLAKLPSRATRRRVTSGEDARVLPNSRGGASGWQKFGDEIDGEYVSCFFRPVLCMISGRWESPTASSSNRQVHGRGVRDHEAAHAHRGQTLDAAVRAHPEAQFLRMATTSR